MTDPSSVGSDLRDAEHPSSDPDEPGTQPVTKRVPRWRPVAAAFVAAAIAIAVSMAVRARADADDAKGELARIAEARNAASEFGGRYLSFDADTIARSSDELRALSTESFAKEFETTRAPGLDAVFAEPGTTTYASVTDVFLSELDRDRIRALVVVDVAATSGGQAQRLADLTFVLELVRSEGRWLVDAVGPAPFPEVIGDGGTGDGEEPTSDSSTSSTRPSEPALSDGDG